MAFIVDFSFAHAAVTDALVARKLGDGCIGGIAYAGSADTRKNITKDELHRLLDAGYQMGLTVENFATDGIGGAAVGTAHAKAILAAAKDLGYDWENCLLGNGYDTNAVAGDYRHLEDYMEAFADIIPVPQYYGDSDSIDFMHERAGGGWQFWQSASSSFSPLNPTPNAHLWQQFADSRAFPLGSSIDVNNIMRTPLRLMGENVAVTDDEFSRFRSIVADEIGKAKGDYADAAESHVFKHPVTTDAAGSDVTFNELSRGLRARSLAAADDLAALEAELAALPTGVDGGLTKADVIAAVRKVFGDAAVATP